MVITRIRKYLYVFKEQRNILDTPSLKIVYLALVQAILMYDISIWGAAYKNVWVP